MDHYSGTEITMGVEKPIHHFVLVHGSVHGAWCWYKVKALLESEGHRVTALDLAACGISMKKIEELGNFANYSKPLIEFLESMPQEEKIVLVGHSFGGISVALGADKFPSKISAAVFVTANMPDTSHRPSYFSEEFLKRPVEEFLDVQTYSVEGPAGNVAHLSSNGPKIMSKLYHLSPREDLALAMMLIRPTSSFLEDLANSAKFSEEGYGSVNRIYVVCTEDRLSTIDRQYQMIENFPPKEVKVIEGSDHMPMFSKPRELCDCLLEIANTY